MPHPSWLNVNPTSGTGNATIMNVALTEYKGRLDRNGVVSATAVNVDGVASYNVIQDAIPEYLTFDAGAIFNVSATGGTIHILGKTNTNVINIYFTTGDMQIAAPTHYIINNSITVANGHAIPNDPGASSELVIDIPLTVSLNDDIFAKTMNMVVNVGDSAFAVNLSLVQAKADARLSTDVSSLALVQQGTAKNFTISSNASWAIS